MDVRPIRFVSSEARKRVTEHLELRISAWARDWCVDAESRVELANVRIPDGRAHETAEWFSIGTPLAGIHGCCSEGLHVFARALANLPANREVSDHPAISNTGRAAMQSLLQDICENQLAAANDAAPADLPDTLFAADAGSLLADLRVGDVMISILAGPQCVESIAPPAPDRPVPLAPRDTGIATQDVPLDISLDLGEVSLDDLRNLQVGDCLTTSVPLDTAFDIALPGNHRFAHGRLGRRHDRRAILLTERHAGQHASGDRK